MSDKRFQAERTGPHGALLPGDVAAHASGRADGRRPVRLSSHPGAPGRYAWADSDSREPHAATDARRRHSLFRPQTDDHRSEEHPSELPSLMRPTFPPFGLKTITQIGRATV